MIKYIIIILQLFPTIIYREGQPFEIEIRPRIIDDFKVIVNIEVENGVKKPIDLLEGFISEFDGDGKFKNEKRITILYQYEPPLQPGFSATKSIIYTLMKNTPHNNEFKISQNEIEKVVTN